MTFMPLKAKSSNMVKSIRHYFRITICLIILSLIIAMFLPRSDSATSPAISIFLLGFLVSCWCNVLLIRGGYIGKSSLVVWILASVLGVPPIGFIGMLFVLARSIKNIEFTGRT
jgi:hypothetical protein